MAFVPNASVVKVALEHQQGTRPFVNTFHVSISPNPDEALLTALAQNVYNIWAGSILNLLSDTTVLQTATLYSMASTIAPVGRYSPTTPDTGNVGGEPLPLQSAAVLTLRSAARGRSGRGRMYISGWGEGSSVSSSLTPADGAALQTAADVFLAGLNANGIPLLVYSTQSGGNDRPQGLALLVNDIQLRTTVFGSQRNRNKREASA